jgi:hypothetical protein
MYMWCNLLLDDIGRVRSQIKFVVCQIQWFDFERNLAMTRKLITVSPPALQRNLYLAGGIL